MLLFFSTLFVLATVFVSLVESKIVMNNCTSHHILLGRRREFLCPALGDLQIREAAAPNAASLRTISLSHLRPFYEELQKS